MWEFGQLSCRAAKRLRGWPLPNTYASWEKTPARPPSRWCVPRLTSSAIRQCAVAALEELGAPAAADTGPLAELAQSEKELEAYWAVTLLGRLGPGAASAERVLSELLSWCPARIGASTSGLGVGPVGHTERSSSGGAGRGQSGSGSASGSVGSGGFAAVICRGSRGPESEAWQRR